jgi:hypothetical protein
MNKLTLGSYGTGGYTRPLKLQSAITSKIGIGHPIRSQAAIVAPDFHGRLWPPLPAPEEYGMQSNCLTPQTHCITVPYDDFDRLDVRLTPNEARSIQASYLERAMRALMETDRALPPRYHLCPASFLHDMQDVWRKRSRNSGDSRYKAMFENATKDRDKTIPDKTFRNWTSGITSIERNKVETFLTVILGNWHGEGQRFCVCYNEAAPDSNERRCPPDCPEFKNLKDRLLALICEYDGLPRDKVFILPAPGYSAEYICNYYASIGSDILFPVDTAHAHSWDEEHFFRSFSIVQGFLKNRHPEKRPKFVYVIKPFTLTQIDAASRQRATGEAIYRAALERMARMNRDLGADVFDDAIRFLVKKNGASSDAAYALPEELVMPYRLADAIPAQSAAKSAVIQIDNYVRKQMHIHGAKDYQYAVARDSSGSLTFYLTCIPERREEGKWIAARYPLKPLSALISGIEEPVHRLFDLGINSGSPISGWANLSFNEFLSLPASRAFT